MKNYIKVPYFIKYRANHKTVNKKSRVKLIHLIQAEFEGLETIRKNIIEIGKIMNFSKSGVLLKGDQNVR